MTKNKIKVAIFHCAFIYSGGGERIVFEELKGLNKKGYEVSCFGHVLDKKNCFPDLIDQYKIQTFLPQLPRWFPLRHAIIIVLSCILSPFLAYRFKDIDIFIGADQPAIWTTYVISKILKKPYGVFMNHPNRAVYPRIQEGKVYGQTEKNFLILFQITRLLKPLIVWLDRISIKNGRFFLTNGFYIRKEIETVYKIKTFPCPAGAYPIDKLFFENKCTVFKGSFKINNFAIKKPYLLCAGRHESWKCFEYVILAMPKVLKKKQEILLIIPGPETNHTPRLKHLVSELGLEEKVLFIGKVTEKELQKLYQEAIMFVFTSPKEDFGMVVIESMAKGVPVVAWNYAGPTDIIVNGVCGYLANPYSISDYSNKIIKLLENQKKRLSFSLASYKRVKENFSWDSHVSIIEKELKKIEKEID